MNKLRTLLLWLPFLLATEGLSLFTLQTSSHNLYFQLTTNLLAYFYFQLVLNRLANYNFLLSNPTLFFFADVQLNQAGFLCKN